jgi:hypothetical protein
VADIAALAVVSGVLRLAHYGSLAPATDPVQRSTMKRDPVTQSNGAIPSNIFTRNFGRG